MIYATDISNLKTNILDKLGQRIIITGSLGRNRFFKKEATIEKAYPNIFTVKYDEGVGNATYSYTDILTRTVEVNVLNEDDTYSPLIPPAPLDNKKKEKLS